MLDVHLKGRTYIAGDSFTMGDIPVGCAAHRWLNLPIERPAFPNLQAWYGRIMARPAAVKVLTLPIT
jgi:glutathione S-transferase